MNQSLRIGILGTRGIPNRYGGFEQCAEYLATDLVNRGHRVWVYNSHDHEYKGKEYKGVEIIHCYDPEKKMGTFGQFIYDLNCIRDARKRNFDILLQLGYTSNSIWHWLWPGNQKNIVNMDGLEWKRSKYNKYVQRFLKSAEKWAALHGDVLIADSPGIQKHLQETYNKLSVFIAYGAEVFATPDETVIRGYGLQPQGYNLLIARMEPENNIEMIIKGHLASGTDKPLIVVGKTENDFGTYLVNTYGTQIRFTGGIYDTKAINNLRYYSHLYFHGHSVGGTNPSLLEAMACNALIAANQNIFNEAILGKDAFYFSDEQEVAEIIRQTGSKDSYADKLDNNTEKIRRQYNWQRITDQYEEVFLKSIG